MRQVLTIACILLFASLSAASAPPAAPSTPSGPCQASVGGMKWDLSSLAGRDLTYKEAAKNYDFSLAVCGMSSQGCGPKFKPTKGLNSNNTCLLSSSCFVNPIISVCLITASMCQHHGLWSYSLISNWENPVWNLLGSFLSLHVFFLQSTLQQ